MNKYYITFGQAHHHRIDGQTFDKDCIAEIEAEAIDEAHKKAMDIFNGVFCRIKKEPDLKYYPRGIIKIL